MARARTTEHGRTRPKSALIDEVSRGIEQFQDILVSIEDFSREGFPYRDAARAKAELQLRECVRRIFGERSPEFQTYRNHKLRTANKSETAQSVRAVKALILTLEEKRLELQGVKPQSAPTPPSAPMTLVRPAVSTTQATIASHPTHSASSISLAEEETSNLSAVPLPTTPTSLASPPSVQMQPPSTAAPIAPPSVASPAVQAPSPPAAPPPSLPADMPTSTDAPVMDMVAPLPLLCPTPVNPPLMQASAPPAPAAIPQVPAQDPPSIRASVHSYSSASLPSQPHTSRAPSAPETLRQSVATTSAAEIHSHNLEEEHKSLERIRKVCVRFHAVSRQLRLRKDYRATLEVDDDYDLQDLLCALLKMEFDEVGVDQWTPPYTEGALRTTFLIHHEQIAVVAKKTRSGLTMKDLTDQVAADSSRYAARDKCTTLFCFIYDPEGRIGSPKRLETDLTSVSDRYMIEVLVAPK